MAKKQTVEAPAVKAVAEAVAGVFISNASNKDKASAVDLKHNATIGQASDTALVAMQNYYIMTQELATLETEEKALAEQAKELKAKREECKAKREQCAEFGFRALRAMRAAGMSYDAIKDLWRSVTDGANLPNVLKVSCSLMENGERLGVKVTTETPRGDFQKAVKKEADKKANAIDEKKASFESSKMGDKLDGDLTLAQIAKQGIAALLVNADLRQANRTDLVKIMARLAADDAKIAADKITESAKVSTVNKATLNRKQDGALAERKAA